MPKSPQTPNFRLTEARGVRQLRLIIIGTEESLHQLSEGITAPPAGVRRIRHALNVFGFACETKPEPALHRHGHRGYDPAKRFSETRRHWKRTFQARGIEQTARARFQQTGSRILLPA